jgi:hypothetical protein
MLAYAAQGLPGSESSGQIRDFLQRAVNAISRLPEVCSSVVAEESLQPAAKYHAFIKVMNRSAQDALAAIELVLAQSTISSQMVDNLNASIHVRTLLTDLFLIDEIFKGRAAEGNRSQPPVTVIE